MKISLLNEEKTKEGRRKLGESIALRRKQRGLTQEQLSELSGVSRVNISKIERGAYNVSFDILSRLAGVMGFDVDLKVSARVKPQPFPVREKIAYIPGRSYFVSFGQNIVVPCTFVRYMEEYNNERIIIDIERRDMISSHQLFPDEIGRTPEEAVERQVTM